MEEGSQTHGAHEQAQTAGAATTNEVLAIVSSPHDWITFTCLHFSEGEKFKPQAFFRGKSYYYLELSPEKADEMCGLFNQWAARSGSSVAVAHLEEPGPLAHPLVLERAADMEGAYSFLPTAWAAAFLLVAEPFITRARAVPGLDGPPAMGNPRGRGGRRMPADRRPHAPPSVQLHVEPASLHAAVQVAALARAHGVRATGCPPSAEITAHATAPQTWEGDVRRIAEAIGAVCGPTFTRLPRGSTSAAWRVGHRLDAVLRAVGALAVPQRLDLPEALEGTAGNGSLWATMRHAALRRDPAPVDGGGAA